MKYTYRVTFGKHIENLVVCDNDIRDGVGVIEEIIKLIPKCKWYDKWLLDDLMITKIELL